MLPREATDLFASYASEKTDKIELDGAPVYSTFRKRVTPGGRVTIRRLRQHDGVVQGLRLKVTRGSMLAANGESAPDMVLWADTAPAEVALEFAGPGEAELRVWNCSRDSAGSMQAWIGNAGIRVAEKSARSITLSCNSRPPLTFEDLVAELTF